MRVEVLNTTAETIPPGGAMEPIGERDALGRVKVRKPTRSNDLAVLVNSATAIPPNEVGTGSAVVVSVEGRTPAHLGVDPAESGTFDTYGTLAGSWYFTGGQRGFRKLAQKHLDLILCTIDPAVVANAGAWVVPLEKVTADEPSACDTAESTDGASDCFPDYYFAAVASEFSSNCHVFAAGQLVYLAAVDGPPPVIGKRCRAFLADGAPPTTVAAAEPVVVPGDWTGAPLVYTLDVQTTRIIKVLGTVAALCEDLTPPNELTVYHGQAVEVDGCDEFIIEDPVWIVEPNDRPLNVSGVDPEHYIGVFQRLRRRAITGSPRKCISVYATRIPATETPPPPPPPMSPMAPAEDEPVAATVASAEPTQEVARCGNLGEVVVVPNTLRLYLRCNGGYGSTTTDARRGLVTTCGTCTPGATVWRIGRECGLACGGYTAPLPLPSGPESTDNLGGGD